MKEKWKKLNNSLETFINFFEEDEEKDDDDTDDYEEVSSEDAVYPEEL